jgi:hypothetical protein
MVSPNVVRIAVTRNRALIENHTSLEVSVAPISFELELKLFVYFIIQ